MTNRKEASKASTLKTNIGYNVPIFEKTLLSVEEAAAYSGVGRNKIRQLTDEKNCDFVIWNGSKRLIKRKKFDEFLMRQYSI